MRTKEFIKKLKEIGFEAEILECDGRYLEVYDDCSKVAEIDIQNFLSINTNYSSFDKLSEEKKQPLFSFLMEYAMTPIEERQEKKYRYKLRGFGGINYGFNCYLNYNNSSKMFLVSDSEDCSLFRTVFTHSWLEERGLDIKQLKDIYEEIEVN